MERKYYIPRSALTTSMKSDPTKAPQFRKARAIRNAFRKNQGQLNLMSPTLEEDIQRIIDEA